MTLYVNMLPYRDGCRLLVWRRLRQWLPVWTFVFLVPAFACGWKYLQLRKGGETLAHLERKELSSRQRMEAVGKIRMRLDQLQQRESLLKTLNSAGRPLQLIGIISQGAALADGDLRIGSFDLTTVSQQTTVKAGSNPSSPAVEHMELSLEGTAINDLSVAGFVAAVEEAGVFDSVVLESSTAVSAKDSRRSFKLICNYH